MSHQSHRRYEVALKGQASKLDFYLDKTELDFGEVPYTEALFFRTLDGGSFTNFAGISS